MPRHSVYAMLYSVCHVIQRLPVQASASLVRSCTGMAESLSVMGILEEVVHQNKYIIRQRVEGIVHGARYNCN